MNPRITVSRNKNDEFEIWLNESGRDLLVRKLLELNESNDHFHLSSSRSCTGITLRTNAYNETDEVFESGKVLFRPEQWDMEFFPHVLDNSIEPPTAEDSGEKDEP